MTEKEFYQEIANNSTGAIQAHAKAWLERKEESEKKAKEMRKWAASGATFEIRTKLFRMLEELGEIKITGLAKHFNLEDKEFNAIVAYLKDTELINKTVYLSINKQVKNK